MTIEASNITMEAILFEDNTATNGGAMFVEDDSIIAIDGSDFADNFATDRGGAIAIRKSTLFINEVNFCSNNTAKWGTIISACNSTFESGNLHHTTDPIYTHCRAYDKIVLEDNDTEDSGATSESAERSSTTTVATTYVYRKTITEVPCNKGTNSAYIVALIIASVVCLILITYVIVDKIYHKLYLRPKLRKHDTVDCGKESSTNVSGQSVKNSISLESIKNFQAQDPHVSFVK